MDEQPEGVLRPQDEVADEVAAPVAAADRVVELPALVAVEPQKQRVRRLGGEAGGQVEQELEVADSSSSASTVSPWSCRTSVSSMIPSTRGSSASESPASSTSANGAARATSSGRPMTSAATSPAPASAA